MLLVTAELYRALASFILPLSFSSDRLPILFQHAHSVSLIVSLPVLITDPTVTRQGSRACTEATISFEGNTSQRLIHIKRALNVCDYND